MELQELREKILGVFRIYDGGQKPMAGLAPNSVFVVIRDVITYFKFGDDRFRGLVSAECQIFAILH